MIEILEFFDAAVIAGTLTSVHPPPGNQKLNAFRVLLVNENQNAALLLCDNQSPPSDFVEGSAKEELAQMIRNLPEPDGWPAMKMQKRVT